MATSYVALRFRCSHFPGAKESALSSGQLFGVTAVAHFVGQPVAARHAYHTFGYYKNRRLIKGGGRVERGWMKVIILL